MQEYFDQLIKVYNTLLSISTKGEDTIMMSQCLTVMRDTLVELQKYANDSGEIAELNN